MSVVILRMGVCTDMESLPTDMTRVVYRKFLQLRSDDVKMGFEDAFQSIVRCIADGNAPDKEYTVYENIHHSIRMLKFSHDIEYRKVFGPEPEYMTRSTRCVMTVGRSRYVIRLEGTTCNPHIYGYGKPDMSYNWEIKSSTPHNSDDMYLNIIREVLKDAIPNSQSTVHVYRSVCV